MTMIMSEIKGGILIICYWTSVFWVCVDCKDEVDHHLCSTADVPLERNAPFIQITYPESICFQLELVSFKVDISSFL